MAETYQLLINMHDVRECSHFVAKAIRRRERKGMDAKASFFTVITALNIALPMKSPASYHRQVRQVSTLKISAA